MNQILDVFLVIFGRALTIHVLLHIFKGSRATFYFLSGGESDSLARLGGWVTSAISNFGIRIL
jgi:hypothetical protein